MPFDHASLLAPVSPDRPCGEVLDHHALYDEIRTLATSPQRPDWGRNLERALALASASRDLRAWVWLTRAALCATGLPGLVAGLRLIADGLRQYWEVLPPQHADEADPRERFMSRLSALTQIGVTNFSCPLDELLKGGRAISDLRADLDRMIAVTPPDPGAAQAIGDLRAAIREIGALFAERFGADRDPQLGFEVLLDAIKALKSRIAAAGPVASHAADGPGLLAPSPPGPLASREDVVRVLDQVIDYYGLHEPSSPVPLLVRRARRLVSFSFMDAIRELAPAGLKELQAVTGVTDERK